MRTGSCAALTLLALVAAAYGCTAPPDPISVSEGTVVILNQSASEWRNVVVTVNDHFRGGAPKLAAGGRLTAPLSQFQTGYGQRFERARQNVFRIEVTATDAAGKPVKLEWGTKRE